MAATVRATMHGNGLAGRLCVLASLVPTAVFVAAVAHAGFYNEDDAPALGRGYFLAYCASCLGADARGDGPVAPSMTKKPADLTRIAARRDGTFPLDELAGFIAGKDAPGAHGTREMPVWGTQFVDVGGEGDAARLIARDQMRVLLLYLKSIQQ